MRQFWVFVVKEFYHIVRDRRTMLILLGIPVAQILLFGFAITSEVKDVQVAVYDPSRDAVTRQITEQIAASSYFDVVEMLDDASRINDIFKYGRINLVIVFGENFAENLQHTGEAAVQLIADGTEPNQASLIVNYIEGILASYARSAMPAATVPSFTIQPEVKMLYNPQLQSSYYFVPGIMGLILLQICAIMTSIAIVREKETGTMEVLLVSPMKPIYIILSKSVPYLVLSMVNLATILLLSVFVLHVPVAGSLFTLLLLSLVYIFLSLSLGLFISTMVDTQMAAILVSGMGLMMPTMLLSGLIFPIESMPAVLQWVSAVVPARWYVEAMKKIMVQGVGIEYVLTELGILTGMATVLVVLSLKKFNVRLN